jgi:hypothetical protein
MEIIQLILEIIIIILGLYMAFFKSYFSEHGKQLALKEHVEDLTKKVETVKSEIDLLTKTKFDLATNERTAILDYHSKYFDWRNSTLALYPSVINESNFDTKDLFFNEVRTKELFAQNSEERHNLFDNSKELNEIKKDTKIACMNMQHHAEDYFDRTAYEYMMFHNLKKTNPLEKHLDLQKEHYDKIKVILQEFRDKKIELFKKSVQLENKLNEYLRGQLFKELQ